MGSVLGWRMGSVLYKKTFWLFCCVSAWILFTWSFVPRESFGGPGDVVKQPLAEGGIVSVEAGDDRADTEDEGGAASEESAQVLVMVMSGRRNFEERQAIRETWGANVQDLVFVVGSSWCNITKEYLSNTEPCAVAEKADMHKVKAKAKDLDMDEANVSVKLLKEIATYEDLIVLDMLDSYGNLPLKTKLSIVWAAKNRPQHWLFKVDDDSIVDVELAREALAAIDPSQPKFLGRVHTNVGVRLDGKWADPKYKAISDFYPPYPIGAVGYALSPRLVQGIGAASSRLELYRNEDASIGIWTSDVFGSDMVKDIAVNDKRFHYELTFTLQKCLALKKMDSLVYGHKFDAKLTRDCWKHMSTLPR